MAGRGDLRFDPAGENSAVRLPGATGVAAADRSAQGSRATTANFQPLIRHDETLSHMRQRLRKRVTREAANNPKGIGPKSPGLRSTSYPGKSSGENHNPKGVVINLQERIGRKPRWGRRCLVDGAQGSRVAAPLAFRSPIAAERNLRSV